MSNVAKEKNNTPAGGRSLRNANWHILFKGLTIRKSLMRKAKDSLKKCTFSNWIKRKKNIPKVLKNHFIASIINLYLYICFHFMKVQLFRIGKGGAVIRRAVSLRNSRNLYSLKNWICSFRKDCRLGKPKERKLRIGGLTHYEIPHTIP